MIWPFKRKPAEQPPAPPPPPGPGFIDRREPNDIRPGDMVECIADKWLFATPFDPIVGDVLCVLRVEDAVSIIGIRAYYLSFRTTGPVRYESRAFRKIVDQDDGEMVERIKRAGRKVDA